MAKHIQNERGGDNFLPQTAQATEKALHRDKPYCSLDPIPRRSPATRNHQRTEGPTSKVKKKTDFDSSLALFKQRKDKNIWEYTSLVKVMGEFDM